MSRHCALLVTVTNRTQLGRQFGPGFVQAVDAELIERARRLCTDGARVQVDRQGNLVIVWSAVASVADRDVPEIPLAELLVRLGGKQSPSAQAAWVAELDGHWIDEATLSAFDADCAVAGSREQMCADFVVADTVLRAISNDAFTLVMNPICNAGSEGEVLYYACSVQCRELYGHASSPPIWLHSIARLGLMHHFDHYVLTRVMDLLEHSPQLSLGVNLSGDTLPAVAQWEKLLSRLGASPSVASRLVVEVDECARIDQGAGRALLGCLQQLGCRVAIDQYGIAFGVDVNMEITRPDIVKIAPLFMEAARESEEATDRLRRLVRLGSSVARDVVLLGAKTDADCQIARSVDAKWVQQ